MSKSGSMPAHPAPPIPRSAPSRLDKARPPANRAPESESKENLSSLESIPSLKMDLSELIIETGKRFNASRPVNEDGDYLEPQALRADGSEASKYPIKFAVNRLYDQPVVNNSNN